MGREVVESWCLWVEFKTDQCKRLSCDLTDGRVRFEIASRVLHNVVLHRCVACVIELNSLIDRFFRTAWREGYLRVTHFDHRNEGLGARSKGIT